MELRLQVTGGAPAWLDGPITLCGRVDQDPERAFTGALSNLMLFDVALTSVQVRGDDRAQTVRCLPCTPAADSWKQHHAAS